MVEETSKLHGFVLLLVLLGMLLGIGVLVLDKFASSIYDEKTIINESFTVAALDATTALANGNLTTLTRIINSTQGVWESTNYTVDLDAGTINNTNNGTSCAEGFTCLATYTYKDFEHETKSTLRATVTAMTPVADTWMPLIVTVMILAIILTIVIRSFGKNR